MRWPPRSRQSRASSRDVIGRLFADGFVGRRQVVAGRFGEQPVEADDFEAGVVGLLADFGALGGRNLVGIHVDRERRDLEARVAEVGSEAKGLVEGPVLERLVADGEAHDVPFLLWCSTLC